LGTGPLVFTYLIGLTPDGEGKGAALVLFSFPASLLFISALVLGHWEGSGLEHCENRWRLGLAGTVVFGAGLFLAASSTLVYAKDAIQYWLR
jgi:hypothetical protein